jgi:hypothetical protein
VKRSLKLGLLVLLLIAVAGVSFAQRSRFGGRYPRPDSRIEYTEGGVIVDEDVVKTAREVASHSTGTPEWTNSPAFPRDGFTFCRVIYSQNYGPYLSSRAGRWITDFPDSDLNLSYRVQQMTSIHTSPEGRILRLTSPDLYDYPWIYMVEPGRLLLSDEEVVILRKYLLNGGFLMADDFWGELAWANFSQQMKRVFPDREFSELPMDHPVFNCVFNLKGPKNKLQVPNAYTGSQSQYTGITWENHEGEECNEMHVRGLFDDKGRMIVIATHNSDNGDGWEREGENDYFFHNFSEKISFPLGINIIFYAMTH